MEKLNSWKIIFLHIPKTAGTTVNRLLERVYGKKNILVLTRLSASNIVRTGRNIDSYDVLRGHFNFGLHKAIDGDYRYIIFLRDPLKRCISLYRYICSDKRHYLHDRVSGLTFEEFLRSNVSSEILNGQSKLLAGDRDEWDQFDESSFNKMINTLNDKRIIVCLTERFDESLLLISNKLQWRRKPLYYKENVTLGKSLEVSKKNIDLFNNLNSFDNAVYKWAVKSFTEEYNKLDSSGEMINLFREENKKYNGSFLIFLARKLDQFKSKVRKFSSRI